MTPDCFYLGGYVPMVPNDFGYRFTGFGEPFCVMMHSLPCSGNCPDRMRREYRQLPVEEDLRNAVPI